MTHELDKATLQFIWSALQEPAQKQNLYRADSMAKRYVESGWVFRSDVEDWMYELDSRLTYTFKIADFSKKLGIHWDIVYYRPRATPQYVTGFEAIRVEDFALFLIMLERIGFMVNPKIIVDYLLPIVKSKTKIFASADLEIFWFNKVRHKQFDVILELPDFERLEDTEKKVLKTANKYKITADIAQDSTIQSIKISSPRYRNRPTPIPISCPDCGINWYKGDTDSSFSHRRDHKRIMIYLNPQPLPKMLKEIETNVEHELVTSKSPVWKHKEIFIRAQAFRREFGYDFIQWHSKKGDPDLNVHGFLFVNELGTIVGACSFRRRQTEEITPRSLWFLDWVWVCPKERHKGHLSTRWNAFRQRFGNFYLSPPVSDNMKAFLAKHNDSGLLEV